MICVLLLLACLFTNFNFYIQAESNKSEIGLIFFQDTLSKIEWTYHFLRRFEHDDRRKAEIGQNPNHAVAASVQESAVVEERRRSKSRNDRAQQLTLTSSKQIGAKKEAERRHRGVS